MPYYALVTADKQVLTLGVFDTKEEAHRFWREPDHLEVVDIQEVFNELERLKDQIVYDVYDVKEMLDNTY